MRLVRISPILWCAAHALACRAAAPDAKSPTRSKAWQGEAAAADAGDTTTTVVAEPQETPGQKLNDQKLNETRVAPASVGEGSTARPTALPHAHDSGRGTADIRAIIVAHRDEARACYDQALIAHPGIEGDLVLQWTIDPKGNVTLVSVDTSRSQIAEPTVIGCITDHIKKLQFAPSAGGFETKASYPFNFHPRHGGWKAQ